MRLYKMELYKICSKKMFLFSALASLAILLIYFWSCVNGIDSTINGVHYTGYQAIKMDKAITEEFKGVLTDQKVMQIIDKYGFPSGVEEDHNAFMDKNYLNNLIMHEFSDGYFYRWDDYQVGTYTYPIAESDLGKASARTGNPVILEYNYGWNVFTEVMQIGCGIGIVLILLALSPVFSEENHINTRQIVFTTKEGKARDIAAKIAAGITITIGVYVVIVILDLVLVWCIFGLDGLNCFYDQVMEFYFYNEASDYMKDFIYCFIFGSFLGLFETGAFSLYFSAQCKSSFQAVILTAMSLLVPLLLNVLGRQSNFDGVLFITSELFIMILLGIAAASFVPDTSNRMVSFAMKTVCCVVSAAVGYIFRRRFMFYGALPVWLIMEDMYSNMAVFKIYYPWMQTGIFIFAAVVSVIFIVCSRKKYIDGDL